MNTPTPSAPREMQQFEALLDELIKESETLGAHYFSKDRHKLETYQADAKAKVTSFVASLAKDPQRLEWLEENPARVVHSKGYRDSCDSWVYQDESRSFRDADTIREAIDNAMTGGAQT